MKRTPLGPGVASLQRGSTFAKPRQPLTRTPTKPRARAISPASPAQRAKVAGAACVVCAGSPCDPAHIIDRSLLTGGQDDARAVAPLCRRCHDAYDENRLSLLEHLEPYHRDRLAFAVERYGLLRTLQRVTGQRWAPAP